MKIALIGASGGLGSRIVKEALEHGHEIKAFCRHEIKEAEKQITVVKKSLFDMTAKDVEECDVFISAFGSGFQADPHLNYEAFLQYIKLNQKAKRPTIVIGGAGSLYTDDTRTTLCMEDQEYPDFLYPISKNIAAGIQKLCENDFPWTVVSPPVVFDQNQPGCGEYQIMAADYVVYNQKKESYATYDDVAKAMVKIAEEQNYPKQRVVVVSER